MSESSHQGDQGAGGPSEEELRRVLEEQMRNTRVDELLVQSVVSLINLSARRIAVEDERDLAQAKLGIDAVRALTDLLPPEVADQVRQALSQLQLEYAQAADAGSGGGQQSAESGAEAASGRPETDPKDGGAMKPTDGPEAVRSKLWTPPGVG